MFVPKSVFMTTLALAAGFLFHCTASEVPHIPGRTVGTGRRVTDACSICSFNPDFLCFSGGMCWGYPTKESCDNAGGSFCDESTCESEEFIMKHKCVKKLNTDAEHWLRAYNIARCMHGAPHVAWSDPTADDAESYASTRTSLVHSGSDNILREHAHQIGAFGLTVEIGCVTSSIYICRNLNSSKNHGGDGEYTANVVQPVKSFETCVADLQAGAPAPTPTPPTPAPATEDPIPAPTSEVNVITV